MPSELSIFSEARAFARFASGLPRFIRQPLTGEQCRSRVEHGLQQREESFLHMLRDGVYARPSSPYLRLLQNARIKLSDIEGWTESNGVEGALEELFSAGVRLTLDEFKGRKPIRRGRLEFHASVRDFDNPLPSRPWAFKTGGSRSGGTRIYVDLAHCEQEAIYDYHFLTGFELLGRPHAIWRPTPPWNSGIMGLLWHAKLGLPMERWFSQRRLAFDRDSWKHSAMTHYVVQVSRLLGYRAPAPEYVPLAEAARVAAWLAEARAKGPPAWLNTNAASAVRVAMAAKEMGLDVSGSLFRCGGEPLTPGKAKVIEDLGCRVVCHYTMGETGRIGMACSAAQAVDDVHVLSDKIAVIRHAKTMTPENEVLVNLYTTLSATPPKLLLNVESGDYGVIERRSCGCVWDRLGYDLHFHTIRSHEKLTSEGMNFLGSDLIQLVEEVLPERFGGHPTDYQFVEVEEEGLPKVELVVSPRVGEVSESDMVTVVLQYLDGVHGGAGHYGDPWREGKTLQVTRQEPHSTGSSKVLALHVLKSTGP